MSTGHRGWVAATVIAGLVSAPAVVRADTLMLRNGRQVTGDVERVDGGYRVKTATGFVQVALSDVAEWKRTGTTAAAAPAAAAPAAPKAAAPAATPARPPTGAPAAPSKPATAPVTAAEKAKRTAEVLLVQGTDALTLGDFKAARDCFVDVIQVDPRNRQALASVGYCYVQLDDIPRATRSLEAAVAGNPAVDRALALNLAYSLFRGRNTMRAAKVIKDYLAAHPGTTDEQALNMYAICLGQSSDEARLSRFWTECVAFYDQYNKKVEATRPGFKRWGVEWIPESDWAITDGKNKVVQGKMDGKWRELQSVKAEFNKLKKQYEDAYASSRFRKSAGPTAASIEPRLRSAKERAEKLQEEYNTISAQLIRPTLPKLFDPIKLDEFSDTAIASASGTGQSGIGSAGLRSDPPSLSEPPTLVKPQPQPQPQPEAKPVPQPQPRPQPKPQPPVAVTPPVAPQPSAEPPPTPEPRKRSVFTYACGFGVGPDLIVTSAATVEGATRITVQPMDSDAFDVELVKVDAASGLALLRVKGQRIAFLPIGDAFAGGVVQCVSYPTPAVFDPESEVISGSAIPPKDEWSIRLAKHPRLAGAPILSGGKVVGVEMASRDNDTTTIPAVTLEALKQFAGVLPQAGVHPDPRQAVLMVSGVRQK